MFGQVLRELQGVDSFVGEIVGDGAKLIFDYGIYGSCGLVDKDDVGYIVPYEEINGNLAHLIHPKEEGDGLIRVCFDQMYEPGSVFRANGLEISGWGLTRNQQKTAFAIFRTIRPLESATRLHTGVINRVDADGLELEILQDTGEVFELAMYDFLTFEITIDGDNRLPRDLRPGYRVQVETLVVVPHYSVAIRADSDPNKGSLSK